MKTKKTKTKKSWFKFKNKKERDEAFGLKVGWSVPITVRDKPKERWTPDAGDKYWIIHETGEIRSYSRRFMFDHNSVQCCRDFLGLYRTKKEALAMKKAIEKFVTERISDGKI